MITKFKLFESRMSDQEIHRICKEHSIRRYIINPDGSISVDGDVRLSDRSLKRIPLVFKEVSGDPGFRFDCSYNQLTSLKDCPEKVSGGFYCYNNQLTSLEGCPKKVGSNFNCSYNKLTSLEGCPEKVGGGFYCPYNQLTSLKDCPDARNIYCTNNQITSFEGIPEFWEGQLYISYNPVYEIFKLFKENVGCIDLINEFDVIQGDRVIRDRLEEVFSQLNMEMPKVISFRNYTLV